MKINVLLVFILFCSGSCNKSNKKIVRFEDYQQYLRATALVSNNPLEEELKFWKDRLAKNINDEPSILRLAALQAELFKSTGFVNHIITSDSLYQLALKNYPQGNVEIYHALAANAITQHKFRDAKRNADLALRLGDKKATSLLIMVDACLETGDYATANRTLRQFKNKNSFAYLIRKAKVKDHEGFLDSAIVCMERAHDRIKGNKTLSAWTLSNLADMYGHAGRIEDSYAQYLQVLKDNPTDDYALKGIAWIVFSHDHDAASAKEIINTLALRKFMPEAHLLLAEIADYEGNNAEKLEHLKKFKSLVSTPNYRAMYYKYLATLEAEEFNNAAEAVNIAAKEIKNRPTPQSYDLLAWGYYHQKEFNKALSIASQQVENQTYEPDALYHLGMIYHANGDNEKALQYLSAALESEFELGPSLTQKIRTAIQNI